MKFIFAAFVLFTALVIDIQGESADVYCPKYYKCDLQYTPFLAHNGCQCKVFPSPCSMEYSNANYGPDYAEVTTGNLRFCKCYATPSWLAAPTSTKCSYSVVYCTKPVDCIDEGYKPITASNGCECKVFRNKCDMDKFNCAFRTTSGGFAEIYATEPCDCKYTPLSIEVGPMIGDSP